MGLSTYNGYFYFDADPEWEDNGDEWDEAMYYGPDDNEGETMNYEELEQDEQFAKGELEEIDPDMVQFVTEAAEYLKTNALELVVDFATLAANRIDEGFSTLEEVVLDMLITGMSIQYRRQRDDKTTEEEEFDFS